MSNARSRALEKAGAAEIPQQSVNYTETYATEIYGSNVFGDEQQGKYLPKPIYKALRKTIEQGHVLDKDLADHIAKGMKQWAMDKGATHYTHWFTPLTVSSTAEKHDSFLNPDGEGTTVAEFGGKELLQGEPDASSFPSGGIRATFEARGYTAWDPTSPVFIRESVNGKTLTIPTAFCSWTGEALDLKTPLLRSNEALAKQASRLLKIFGKDVDRCSASVGPEQEYFLIDKAFFTLRPDLIATGRTLFGAPPPKGQELEDQYFGSIRERILAYMQECERELFKLGIPAKTRHNEVAPAQFEIAPVYESINIGADHHLMVMQTLKDVAGKYGLVCLLHEKPFKGVNGSGKHNNWSVGGPGFNLLEPGPTPHDNAQFLVVLAAILRGVDRYQGALRAAVADAGNDHRLGANEAPPAIMSAFLGTQLSAIVEQIASGKTTSSGVVGDIKIGVTPIPPLRKDATDRNRTSPFAFTGNKFEFRAQGSSANIMLVNTVLNALTAESFDYVATKLEADIKGGKDLNTAVTALLKTLFSEHKRIIFDGNNYSEEWHAEAAKRGLRNAKTTPEALKAWSEKETLELFSKYGILSEKESESRAEIYYERYNKVLNIEASMTVEMAKNIIFPAALKYQQQIASALSATKAAAPKADLGAQEKALEKVASLNSALLSKVEALQASVAKATSVGSAHGQADKYVGEVFPAMQAVREVADELELLVDDSIWPLPKYREMLFVY
jgi:glutamine synthetase